MDFVANDELDYEEDELERDLLKSNSKTMTCLGNELNTNTDFPRCSEEDYLQINCSEEDENFFSDEQSPETFSSKIAAEETLETQKVQKVDDESKEAKEQKTYMKKGLCTQTNHSNDFNYNDGIASKNKIKVKKNVQPLPWRRKTSRKPEFSFATFDAFQKAQVLQQGKFVAYNKKFMTSNSPMGKIKGRSLTQQRFKPLMRQSLSRFDEEIREFKSGDQISNCPKKLTCNNKMDCDVSSKIEKLSSVGFTVENAKRDILRRNRGNFNKPRGIGEPKEGCGLNTPKDSDVRNARCVPLSKSGWEYEGSIDEQKKCFLAVSALKDAEKELLKLKKEDRRKRFMQDAIINKKEKESFEPYVVTKSRNYLPNDFLKMGEPKLLEKKFQRREDKDYKSDHVKIDIFEDFLPEKTNFKKELLLKKRNPFGGRMEMTKCTVGTGIKKEVFWNETLECAESLVSKEAKIEKELMENDNTKVLGGLRSKGPGLFVVKNEKGSQVKFVRTISKSLDELGFGKSKTEVIPERNDDDDDDDSFALKPLPFSNENMREQVTLQLTGRIVKVLNIPPSATTNDILSLCGDIGIVREVKLNFPKENSAVIRFAEPSSAENFFSLYHGQKMDNYFLNVIII